MPAPAGTLTLVFTDVQDSSRLWERLGKAFEASLAIHNGILRSQIASHSGYEVKTEGDAFVIAFQGASDALRFALAVQEALLAAPWPADLLKELADPPEDQHWRGLRVRIGMHTGEPVCVDDPVTGRADYLGPPVNRAARVAAASHGGQTLISDTTFIALGRALDELCVEDLGEYRLKGLERAERLRQVLTPALAKRKFGPLRAQPSRVGNLPPQHSTFVGRERELAALSSLLAQSPARKNSLLTITGPGGTGKTRLSLRTGAELVDRFEGGVWFTDLSSATSAEAVALAVAQSLGAPIGAKPEHAVAAILEMRPPLLLILDNFEQVASQAAATVGMWRAKAAHATFLVTSRALLGLPGEQEFELEPLSAPFRGRIADAATLIMHDSVKLFLERARESRPNFELTADNAQDIASICAELEGVPLAIELAAARLRIISPAQMRKQLGGRISQKTNFLSSMKRDVPPRQRTLEGAIDWSFKLLEEWEKEAFLQASVFRGGFSIDAAQEIIKLSSSHSVLDAIQSLREKSLIRSAETRYETRLSMYAVIREYAELRLRASLAKEQVAELERRHAEYYVKLATAWDRRIHSAQGTEALDRIELEFENLAAARERCLQAKWAQLGMEALMAGGGALAIRRPQEDTLAAAVSLEAVLPQDHPGRAELLITMASKAAEKGNRAGALAWLDRAQAFAANAKDDALLSSALQTRAWVLFAEQQTERAIEQARAAVDCAERSDSYLWRVTATLTLGKVLREVKPAEALQWLIKAEHMGRTAGDLRVGLAAVGNQGNIHRDMRDYENARRCYTQAEKLARSLGDKMGIVQSIFNLAQVSLDQNEFESTLPILLECEQMFREAGAKRQTIRVLQSRALALAWLGRLKEALECIHRSEVLSRELEYGEGVLAAASRMGWANQQNGRYLEAMASYERAQKLAADLQNRQGQIDAWLGISSAALQLGRYEIAAERAENALKLADDPFNRGAALKAAGAVLLRRNQFADAAKRLSEAQGLLRQTGSGDANARKQLVVVQAMLAETEMALGRVEQSKACSQGALADSGAIHRWILEHDAEVRAAVEAARRLE